MRTRSALGLLSVLLAATAIAISALAGSSSAAEPCGPPLFVDPAGDAKRTFTGTPADPPAGPAQDLRAVYLTYTGGKLTARIQVTDMSKTPPSGAQAVSWYLIYTAGGVDNYVAATTSGADYSYEYGTATTGSYTTVGATTGAAKEGPNGYVDIQVPVAAKGALGTAWTNVFAKSFEGIGDPAVAQLLITDDRAPDAGGKSYTVTACPAGGGDAASPTPAGGGTGGGGGPAPTPSATPSATPKPGSPPGGGASGGGGSKEVAAGKLPVKLARSSTRAKGKTISAALKSTEAVSGLQAQLYKGAPGAGKPVATGSLARLKGKGTLRLKAKAKVKAGRYSLYLAGRRANGSAASVVLKLRVR